MLRQVSIFTLALVSGAATAGPLASTVNGLLGIGGPATASVIAPITGPLTGGISTFEATAAPVTSAAPLPGLEPSKASGDVLALGVLDGDNTGNGGSISAAVLSGTNSGASGDPSGMSLSVGVLNQGDPLHIYGMGMGIGTEPGLTASPLPVALTDPLLGVSDMLYTGLRGLTALGEPLAPLGALEAITNDNPLPTEATLFGGSANENRQPSDVVEAGVLSGNNSGSGGNVGASVLSTSPSSNPDSTAKASDAGVGVLNGNGGTTPPPVGGPIVDPGANPDPNDETAQNDGESELCALLAKDNRGQVKGKLREKAHCLKMKTPKA